MTIDQLIAAERAKLTAKLAERKTHDDVLDAIRSACVAENRDPSEDEAGKVTAARDAKTAIDAEIQGINARIEEFEAEKRADEEADRLSREVTPAAARPAHDRVARVGAEERTYRPDNDRDGRQFVLDVARQFLFNEPGAAERLSRHMREEQVERGVVVDRAAGSGAFSGLVVPQYLFDLYAPIARAGRPFADACTHHDLPAEGMTVEIGKVTTGTSTDLQANENDAVAEQNIDDTLMAISVQTNAGQQTLSRQAVERGRGVDEVTVQDLFRAYATKLDSTLLNQATTGLSAVATDTNYTDASPTAGELWPKLIGAEAAVEAALLDADTNADVAVMHSRRFAWLKSQLTSSWPAFAMAGRDARALGSDAGRSYGSGYRGEIGGINIIVDNNIATNFGAGTEDEIYVVNLDECHLWEDPNAPLLIRAEQAKAANLGILLVVYGYFAYTFTRRAHAQKISDTGLIAPTF